MDRKLRIIVADDEEMLRNMMAHWLAQLGHEVETVGGGLALVELCRNSEFDLVISDVRMPDLDGLSAAVAIRRSSAVPIILMSGTWSAEQSARAEAMGIPWLEKPIRPLHLVTTIEQARAAAPARKVQPSDSGDALFRQLVETAEDVAIFTIDPEGRVTHWNRGAETIFGYRAGEILGTPWTCLFTPTDNERGIPKQELRTALAEGKAPNERWHLRSDGTEFWTHGLVIAQRSADGELLGYGVIARDRTDLKRREDAILAQSAALHEAHEKRMVFLATFAHELRNPLMPLLICSQLLRNKFTDPDVRGLGEKMERQVRHLGRMVEDLEDTASVCLGDVEIEREIIDLCTIVKQGSRTAAAKCAAAGQILDIALPDEPVWLDGDSGRLCQVVANLLDNAAKYTPPAGRIELSLIPDSDTVALKVRDSGIGIPADRLDSIFDLFSPGECNLPGGRGGLGIGLALVRELVTRHGGTVVARSDGANRGSEFVVRLPLLAP